MSASDRSAGERPGRTLGLDPGRRWVGVAISDDEGRLALPLATVDRQSEADDGLARIKTLAESEGAMRAVIGIPLGPDGREDDQATDFRAYGERVAAAIGLPLEVQNERFSNPLPVFAPPTKRRRGRTSVAQHKERREREHAVAAANILQRWLDHRRTSMTGAE